MVNFVWPRQSALVLGQLSAMVAYGLVQCPFTLSLPTMLRSMSAFYDCTIDDSIDAISFCISNELLCVICEPSLTYRTTTSIYKYLVPTMSISLPIFWKYNYWSTSPPCTNGVAWHL